MSSILCYSQRWQKTLNVDISRIIGFIGVGGPYSFSGDMSLSVKLLLNQLFKKGYDRKLGEPCFLMDKNHIPMLLIQSKHDGVIEYSCAEKLCEKANKKNTHSWYTAGMFLETRKENFGLDKFFSWIENL